LKKVLIFIAVLIVAWATYLTWFITVKPRLESNDTTQILEAGKLSDQQWEFLKDVSKLIEYAEDMGYKITAGEMYRTKEQQNIYIMTGRSWTWNSKHLKRLAFDINLYKNGRYTTKTDDYRDLGEYWKSLNPRNRWGGDWRKTPDPYHFERNY